MLKAIEKISKALVLGGLLVGGAALVAAAPAPQAPAPVVVSTAPTKAPTSKDQVVLTKYNVIVMNDVFTPESTMKVALAAQKIDEQLPPGETIYLVLSTPGGDVDAGTELIRNLNNLQHKVSTITLFAASMGFHTVEGLGERLITTDGVLMAHRAKGGFQGEFPGQLDSRLRLAEHATRTLDEHAISRTGGKLTYESFRKLIDNELWMQGQEAVDLGLADRVVGATCDASLDGTTSEAVTLHFMGMSIELNVVRANCPLITGVLVSTVGINGKNVDPSNLASIAAAVGNPNIPTDVLVSLQKKIQETVQSVTGSSNVLRQEALAN